MKAIVHDVPGAHFDLGWCGTPEACLCRGDRIILSAVHAITEQYKDYKFTVEYDMFLEHFLVSYPRYYPVVKELIDEGKMEVACSWAGIINQILDGEAVIRDITRAKRWIKKKFNVNSTLGQLTDLPGHTRQIPQILSKCGIKYMAYSRYHPPVPLHIFKGPDGSRVIACNHPNHYDWAVFSLRKGYDAFSKEFPKQVEEIRSNWPAEHILMGDGSDLMKPDPTVIETINNWNEKNKDIEIKISTTSQFFENIDPHRLPVFEGEMPYGFATIPAFERETYKWARKGVSRLIAGEKLSCLRELLGLGKYDWSKFEKGWQAISYPHDHNVGGKHGEINDRVRTNKSIEAYEIGDEALRGACSTLAENVKLSQEGVAITIFNSLSYSRDGLVEAYVDFEGKDIEGITIKEVDGNIMQSQVVKRDVFPSPDNDNGNYGYSTRIYFVFYALNVPSLGYATYYMYPSEKSNNVNNSNNGNNDKNSDARIIIENKYYRVIYNDAGIESIYSRTRGVNLLDTSHYSFGEVLVLQDVADDINEKLTGKKWRMSVTEPPQIIEQGPVRTIIRCKGEVMGCGVVQDLCIYNINDYFDISIEIDWRGTRNQQVRMAFPFNMEDSCKSYETPFCSVRYEKDEMPGTYRGIGGRFVQNWVDISGVTSRDNGLQVDRPCLDKLKTKGETKSETKSEKESESKSKIEYGVTICTKHGAFNLGDEPGEVFAVLLRTAFSCGDHHYWYENKGKHRFSFRVIPHNRHETPATIIRMGKEFNNPLHNALVPMPVVAYYPNSKKGFWKLEAKGLGQLPEKLEAMSIREKNVFVSAFVKSENDRGWVMRLFESDGINTDVHLKFMHNIKHAKKVNFMEEPVGEVNFQGYTASLEMGPYEICEIYLEFTNSNRYCN